MPTLDTLLRHRYENERAKVHDFVMRELELGKRAAVLFGNEAEGWGPWVNTVGMFDAQPRQFIPRQRANR